MKTFDRYVKESGKPLSLSPAIVFESKLSFPEAMLRPLARRGGEIERLIASSSIPDYARKQIIDSFGVDPLEHKDGFLIFAGTIIEIYGQSEAGVYYAVNTLMRYLMNDELCEGIFYNYPNLPLRGLKAYLPARGDIAFFKETIDLCGYLGYNTLILEIGGAMEYKRHPEINEGWEEYAAIFSEYQGKSIDVQRSFGWSKNSIHCENGGGSYLSQQEVSELAEYCKKRYIEIIPEVPSLSHCDYLLTRHKELAERQEDPLPDTYCPSNPESYKLIFDVLDEVIEVFKPRTVNIGHDELYSTALCDKCRLKSPAELYADDIKKIYEYLKGKNVQTMIWAEKLLKAYDNAKNPLGGLAHGDAPETFAAIEMLPKDIQMLHWYWEVSEECENQLFDAGYTVFFGNFKPTDIQWWEKRKNKGLQGVCISNWSLFNASHMQRNHIFLYLGYGALQLWRNDFNEDRFKENFLKVTDELFLYKNYSIMKKPHILITHFTTEYIKHPPFVDGYQIDEIKDTLGQYKITYNDGSCDLVPIIYGINIGNGALSFERANSPCYDTKNPDEHLGEPSFTCKYITESEKLHYQFAVSIPAGRTVTDVELVNGEGKVFLENLEICNG